MNVHELINEVQIDVKPGQLYLALERDRHAVLAQTARRNAAAHDLRRARIESVGKNDQRVPKSVWLEACDLLAAARRLLLVLRKRGVKPLVIQLVRTVADRLHALTQRLDRVAHRLAPSSLAGTGSVGESSAEGSASTAGDSTDT